MLIPSHRHTPADLAHWHEQELADHLPHHRHADRLLAAKLDIENFIEHRGRVYAGVSWGKDSVVVAHLLYRFARHVPLMHLRPTNHNPDCDAVRDAYFAAFPGQPYEEVPVDYSGIDRTRLTREELDRATDQRWYAAIRQFGKSYSGCILGIRADESATRRLRMLQWGVQSPTTLAPIGFWPTRDVFSYLARNRLPVHPAYAMTGGGLWERERIRVAEIGDTCGTGNGRAEWEAQYYGDCLRRYAAQSRNHAKQVPPNKSHLTNRPGAAQ